MIILGIETSCDETAASVLKISNTSSKNAFPHMEVLSHIVASQIKIHEKTGGVVPEVAAREHVKSILPVIDQAIQEGLKKKGPSALTALAVTHGPGLITSLSVGVDTAKALSLAWKKPLIGINHLAGHIAAAFVEETARSRSGLTVAFPVLALIVSGGHTELVLMKGWDRYEHIGQTRDDAVGEAFDKVAKILGLPYPGGPSVSSSAKTGKASIAFPRPMLKEQNFDFSFSGLKTAVLYHLERRKIFADNFPSLERKKAIADICASFEAAVSEVIVEKTMRAIQRYRIKTVAMGGGVAANETLRTRLTESLQQKKGKIKLFIPPTHLCTDNATMIAAAAAHKALARKYIDPSKLTIDSRLPLIT